MTEELRKAGFSGRILDSSSADFAAASRRYSAISEARNRYISFPKTPEDVSVAIVYATKANLKIAIKCGGHHASGGNSVEDGLVIDLGGLKSVALSQDRTEVTIGGGCLWGDVYVFLRSKGLACVGGGVHNVGVGGHITGGGYGPLTQRYGMACDHVISATVVLANGRIVRANDMENSDLLWGIRGGSSNFGVVVELVLRTVPDPGVWIFRSVVLQQSDLPTIIPRFVEHCNDPTKKTEDVVLVFLNFVRGPHNEPLAVLNFTLCGPIDKFSGLFKWLLEGLSPLRDTVKEYPSLVELSHALDDLLLAGPRRVATGGLPVVEISSKLIEELWKRWLDYTDSNPDVVSSKIIFELHKTKRHRPENSCLRVHDPIHNVILVSGEHNEAKNDHVATNWIHETIQMIRQRQAKDWGRDLGVWANACMPTETAKDCWGPNYPRLQELKARYDPTCVFDRMFPIKPSQSPV